MQRIPQAKSQAAILVREMKAAGTPIKYQQALETVAKMSGFRDWNAMAAAPDAPVAPAEPAASTADSKNLRKLIDLCWGFLNTCSNEGCDGCVVGDEDGHDALVAFLDDVKKPTSSSSEGSYDAKTQIALLWSIDDVLSVRPDLTEAEALDVLQQCARKHDASCGVTWDTIRDTADWYFHERELTGTIEFINEEGVESVTPAVVKLASQARVYVDGKLLREFNSAADGDFKVDGLPDEEFPVMNGSLFGNENNDGDIQNAEIGELLEALEKAGALKSIDKH